jgi:hypothetical protein
MFFLFIIQNLIISVPQGQSNNIRSSFCWKLRIYWCKRIFNSWGCSWGIIFYQKRSNKGSWISSFFWYYYSGTNRIKKYLLDMLRMVGIKISLDKWLSLFFFYIYKFILKEVLVIMIQIQYFYICNLRHLDQYIFPVPRIKTKSR